METDTRNWDALVERVNTVERRNRFLTRMGVVLVGVLAAMTAMGQAEGVRKSVEAEQFVVRDPSGRPRALLNTHDNRVALALYDAEGQHRIVLDLEQDGAPWVRMFDATGKVRASVTQQRTGGVVLSLNEASGKPRAMLGTRPDGSPYLSLLDAASRERAIVTTRKDGAPHLALIDEHANERMVLDLDEENFARLTLRDDKRTRAILGKTPIARMKQGRVVFMPPGSLVFYDELGEVVFSKP